jgi:hypothetical protein
MSELLEAISPLPENGVYPREDSYLSGHKERAFTGHGSDRLFFLRG